MFDLPGGLSKVAIADAETDANAELNVEVPAKNLAEGTEIPEPEAVVAAILDGREGRTAIDQSLTLRFTRLAATDFDDLERIGAVEGRDLFVTVTSLAKNDAGDPLWEVTYKDVTLSHVAHGPSADKSTYGSVIVDGMATGYVTSEIYSLTQNSFSATA